jgi:hypothetical protein
VTPANPAVVLQEQPSSCFHELRCIAHDSANFVQAIRARDKRTARLKSHIAAIQVRVPERDVGRVRYDDIEALAANGRKPIAVRKLDLEAELRRITLGVFERRGADFDRDHARARPVALDRKRHRARPGAEIEHARSCGGRNSLEREINEQFSLRARDQHRRSDRQRQAIELAPPDDVGDRFAGAPARDHLGEARLDFGRKLALALRDHARFGKAARFGKQQAGLARLDAGGGERERDIQISAIPRRAARGARPDRPLPGRRSGRPSRRRGCARSCTASG